MAASAIAPVSVVIPCYRCAGTIERAVASVAAQSQRPAELILVDDASGDRTGAVLEEIRRRHGPDWIRILTLSRNQGPASARNAGWDAASSKYVAFLDADDAWHPRKVEIQCAWMEAHPEFAVTGHASRQLAAEAEPRPDPAGGGAQAVSTPALFVSNQFITPSVMLRRQIARRFEAGKRYMEDYLLWLELALSGQKIARLPQVLAYTFKAPFGESGLSAQAWKMEKGELATFVALWRGGRVGLFLWLMLSGFSLLKFVRRLVMLAVGYSPAEGGSHPQYLFPAAYLVLTQAMTALLVGAGVLGHSELAADIGIVQAATLATFFAFSGNARNLILTTQASIPPGGILAARIALLLPLCALALLLSIVVARVDAALALVLVGRRAVEWIGELELNGSELRGDRSVAAWSLRLQSGLLLAALLTIAFAPAHAYWAILAWAAVPLLPALRFAVPELRKRAPSLRAPLLALLPHVGSTAVMGFSLYAYRALLVLVAGRAVAGDLFAAFAVGSFLGTIFANVLGASFSLHEERSGRAYLPRWLWAAILLYLVSGAAILAAGFFAPGVLESTNKSLFFWRALGWSLLGGVVMVAAQRSRLRLLAQGRGEVVFGPDVMIHVLLIAAVPVLYATDRSSWWAMLYALNAVLALVFYATSERGLAQWLGPRAEDLLAPILAFCIFFPLFFLLSGAIYNPADPWIDSGGVLRNLPLPVSVLACFGGLLLMGRYGLATPGLWTILAMLVLMLLSAAMLAGSDTAERSKMLLMLQILLPTFGLVLGAAIDPEQTRQRRLEIAVVAAVALVVPAQLVASWLGGSYSLTHDLLLFGVYQHFEFVPVILICGFLMALPGVWESARAAGKTALAALFALLAAYAAATYSVNAMLAIVAGVSGFAVLRIFVRREPAAVAAALLVLGSLAGYNLLVRDTDSFHRKFSYLFPPNDGWAFSASENDRGTKRQFSAWLIDADVPGRNLLRIARYDRSRQARLVVEGELERGEFLLKKEDPAGRASAPELRIDRPGPFRAEIEFDRDRDGDVLIAQGGAPARGVVRRLQWTPLDGNAGERQESGAAAQPSSAAPAASNVTERIADWKLFGSGIVESLRVFFFGHEKIMSRGIRSSAHNFYLDFTYNFGVLALLPLLALLLFTLAQLWRQRRALLGSEALLAHAAVVLFLVLIECNAKVALRQPYSGIAICFLWGLLLARLRALEHGRRSA